MTKRVRELRDLVIDEISLVDKGANQHAHVTIAKRHGEEEQDMEYFDESGELVDITSLELGDVVYDESGQAYEFQLDEGDDDDEVDEPEDVAVQEKELEPVGKALRRPETSYAAQVREELSKAMTDRDRDEVISKALGVVDEVLKRAETAEQTAQAERQLRVQREYTEIAKGYNLPVSPEELGPVLMRLAEALSVEDQKVIAKCLDAASSEVFEEIGKRGGGANSDVFTEVEAYVDNLVSKSGLSREEAITAVFEQNPKAYDDYLAERSGH